MQKKNDRIVPPKKEINDNGMKTYVMTDYPYTQPMIFNTIKASISKGLIYTILSLVFFMIVGKNWYAYMAPCDVAMIGGMLFICFVVKPKVCLGHIGTVNQADKFSITLAGETLGFMWSAFARLPIMFLQLSAEGLDVVFEWMSNSYKLYMGIWFVVGVGVFLLAMWALLGKTENVYKNHHSNMVYYKRLIGYKDPTPVVEDMTKTYNYGEIRSQVKPPVQERKTPPKPAQTSTPDAVSRSKRNVNLNSDQEKVSRGRRKIDI